MAMVKFDHYTENKKVPIVSIRQYFPRDWENGPMMAAFAVCEFEEMASLGSTFLPQAAFWVYFFRAALNSAMAELWSRGGLSIIVGSG
ncbi:hypothetical protein VC83_08987 [Pseudogymnoascus destructans]|uniref:Uncharacterized protein n=1 Tax=Pseudogymnoascus destructans TaxID=655981 RepID=A0A177A0S4_9PEZI|nr:uncharacterized protein VC83_08987 [Pseudogymnoascus destructans]OAF54693.1 hypothetical protein VC83_08987 [Pseudogymnoascus destructans]